MCREQEVVKYQFCDIYIISTPTKAQGASWKRGQKDFKSQKEQLTSAKQYLPDTIVQLVPHMNSEQLGLYL